MKKKLMLVDIKNYKRKDGTNGSKLIFIDANDAPFVGFCDPDIAEQYREWLEADLDEYNSARAREYTIVKDVYNGVMTYKVDLNDTSV